MTTRRNLCALSAALAVGLALTPGGCSSGSDSNGGDADDFQQQLTDAADHIPAIKDAFTRLAAALNGTEQEGVILTPTADGFTGSVDVFIDSPTSPSTVNGSLTYLNPALGLAGGATLAITSIDDGAPQTASGSAVVHLTSPTTAELSEVTFTTHTDTRGNDLTLSNGTLQVNATDVDDFALTGTMAFDFNGLEGELTFEHAPNNNTVTVSGNGFDSFVVGEN